MVEEAVVLVVVEEDRGLRPDVRVRGQGVQHPVDVVGAVGRRVGGVLGLRGGGDDPGDRGEVVGGHVGGELGDRVGGLVHAALVELRAGRGGAELREPGQRVVVVVVGLLVDPPADPGVLEALGVGGPGVALLAVVGDRAARGAGGIDPTRPLVEAVGVGRALDRAEVLVADGEGVGEGVLEGDVGAGVVAHGLGRLGRDPVVVEPVVPGRVGAGPGVVEVGDPLGVGVLGVQVPGLQHAAAGWAEEGLLEDVRAAGEAQQ